MQAKLADLLPDPRSSALLAGLGSALLVVSVLGLAPATLLLLECVAAALPGPARRRAARPDARPALAVLVPAHDEERTLGATLGTLAPELAPGDRLLVVADNCSDATAEVARQAGAEVAVRRDDARRGKGHALRFGLDVLRAHPPAIVVVVDADCGVEPGALDALALSCAQNGRPAQACYLMRASAGSSALSRFAFLVKNRVRPLGLLRLGLPCQLMGTGMAFPWTLIAQVGPEAANIVEDLQLGADLALAGHPPLYVPDARVTSALPDARSAAALAQRTRWEHGHIQTLVRMGPRLLLAGLRARRLGVAALGADLCIPPLSLLVALQLGLCALAALGWLVGAGPLPLALAALGPALTATAICVAWLRHGRDLVAGRELLRAPLYVLRKLPIYRRFVGRRQREWVRTEREP